MMDDAAHPGPHPLYLLQRMRAGERALDTVLHKVVREGGIAAERTCVTPRRRQQGNQPRREILCNARLHPWAGCSGPVISRRVMFAFRLAMAGGPGSGGAGRSSRRIDA